MPGILDSLQHSQRDVLEVILFREAGVWTNGGQAYTRKQGMT